MRIYFPLLFSLLLSLLFSYLAGKVLHSFNRHFWQYKNLNIIAKYLPFIVFPAVIIWMLGHLFHMQVLKIFGTVVLVIIIIYSITLILTIPISIIINYTHRYIRSQKGPVDHSRRQFIRLAAVSIPFAAMGTASKGLAESFDDVRITEIPFYFKNLPEGLDGFRILHLTDAHLGYYFQLSDLEKVLLTAESYKPHLVVVTGDIADDFSLLPEAVKLIGQLNAPYNGFIVLGNHEYFHGFRKAMKIISSGSMPLLVNSGITLSHKKEKIFIAGLDDPRVMHMNPSGFYKRSIALAMADASNDSFNILLSHRPRPLDLFGEHKIDLILAGHTHGGQIGYKGRSIFEGIMKEPYLWGKYKKGNTQLYTSSGLGHWFPFRFNCPPEAPLITLKKSNL